MTTNNPEEKLYSTEDAVEALNDILSKSKGKKYSEKIFTWKELGFIGDVVLRKDYRNVLPKLADYIIQQHNMGMPITNTAMYRRVEFFKHFFATKGNATKAAVAAGYSPKSAKQQGHRTLRWIQRQASKTK